MKVKELLGEQQQPMLPYLKALSKIVKPKAKEYLGGMVKEIVPEGLGGDPADDELAQELLELCMSDKAKIVKTEDVPCTVEGEEDGLTVNFRQDGDRKFVEVYLDGEDSTYFVLKPKKAKA